MSPEAYKYLTEFLDIIQENSINRYKINWGTLRAEAYQRASAAQTTADTYDTIQYVLIKLDDQHSFFLDPQSAAYLQRYTVERNLPYPEGKLVEGKIGYVRLWDFMSIDQEQSVLYADTLQKIIITLDAQSPCGWIVDLRWDRGGNMWPMIAGLGSLLGEGQIGAFVDPDGNKIMWWYKDGQVWEGDEPSLKVGEATFHLQATDPPIAVLTGPDTASSGEAVVVAFRGRPNTRFFGKPTAGKTTGNELFILSDGAEVGITGVTFVDRTGQVYGGKIIPDEQLIDPSLIPKEVTNWLLSQQSCMK